MPARWDAPIRRWRGRERGEPPAVRPPRGDWVTTAWSALGEPHRPDESPEPRSPAP